jgi:ribosomal protein S18 acetylase RimI-like enzyme
MWVIAVLPGHIGRGIGGALLEKAEAWLFSEGCSELWLTTDLDTRLRAYLFYKKHGWRDWKIENGLRYMKKMRLTCDAANGPFAVHPQGVCHDTLPWLI